MVNTLHWLNFKLSCKDIKQHSRVWGKLSQMKMRTKLGIILVLTVAIILLATNYVVSQTELSRAANDFGDLLINLDHLVRERQGLIVYIRLVNPPIEDEDRTITLGPQQDWFITEVGVDYVCFRKIVGGASLLRCELFSNISGISYLEN